MKKIAAFILTTLLLLCGCTSPSQMAGENQVEPPLNETISTDSPIILETAPPSKSPTIVCTIFPQYDWARQILGGQAELFDLILLGNRIDFHNFQPSVDNIVTISTCDLFIYIGGESDGWVDGVLKNSLNPEMIVLNLLALLDVDELENFKETKGFPQIDPQTNHSNDHHHDHHDDYHDDQHEDHHDDYHHDHDEEMDEHIWLSLANAAFLTQLIKDAIISLDPTNHEIYEANASAYLAQLQKLDHEYHEIVKTSAQFTLLCGDRFPFHHLAGDYGLDYYAAFPGCSAETEASFETIIYLAGKIDELKLTNLIVTESSDQSIAKTIIGNTLTKDQEISVLDSMQSISATDASQITYLAIMENNLKVLREILK